MPRKQIIRALTDFIRDVVGLIATELGQLDLSAQEFADQMESTEQFVQTELEPLLKKAIKELRLRVAPAPILSDLNTPLGAELRSWCKKYRRRCLLIRSDTVLNDSERESEDHSGGSLAEATTKGEYPPPAAPDSLQAEDPIAVERREMVDAFIDKVLRATGDKVTKTMIWKAAGHSAADQFEAWQRNSTNRRKISKAADVAIRRVLRMEPCYFLERAKPADQKESESSK